MSSLVLRLLTPRALDKVWREDVSHGRISVPVTEKAPEPLSEIEAEILLRDEDVPLVVRFQAQEELEIPFAGKRVRGPILNRQEVEQAFLRAISACPVLGRTVLVATVGQPLGLGLIPPLNVEGARVTVVHDGDQAFEVLSEGLLYLAAAVLEVSLDHRSGPRVVEDLVRLGGEPDFPIFLVLPEEHSPEQRLAWANIPGVAGVLEPGMEPDVALATVLEKVGATDTGWHQS